MDLDALHSFTFKRLQDKCISKGLSKSGTKKQLIVRLKLYYSTNGQLLSPQSDINDEMKFDYTNVTTQIMKSNMNETAQKPSKNWQKISRPAIPPPPPPTRHTKAKSAYSECKTVDIPRHTYPFLDDITQIHSKSKSEYVTLQKAVSCLSLNLQAINDEINENKSTDISELEPPVEPVTEFNALSPINNNQLRRTRSRNVKHNENKYNDDIYSIRIANRGMGIGFVTEVKNVIVSEILQNSRAMFLGISKGDILIKINDIEINNADEYYEYDLPFTATFKHITQKKNKRANSMPPIKKLKIFNKNTLKINNYIINKCSLFQFDTFRIYKNGIGVCFVVSNWYVSPEWSIKILKSDTHRQEVGIVTNVNEFKISNDGLINSNELGARCFFGTDNGKQAYYASINEDGTHRNYSNISNNNLFCWKKGDIIKIKLNVKKWNICFYLNGVKIKKAISIQPNQIYYPCISFIGDCKYEIRT